MPLPQAGTASVVLDDELLVFGGEIFSPEAAVFPNAWRYSLVAGYLDGLTGPANAPAWPGCSADR